MDLSRAFELVLATSAAAGILVIGLTGISFIFRIASRRACFTCSGF
jgi:hypothetical protein